MAQLNELFKSADFKSEKHVPVIEVSGSSKKGESIDVTITVGKEIAHPNTTEHHISWIKLYFLPEGGKFPYELGSFEFSSHGASVQGPNTSTVYSDAKVIAAFKTEKSGTILASSYCNIHGLWQDSSELSVG
jgi:superoxide reductase